MGGISVKLRFRCWQNLIWATKDGFLHGLNDSGNKDRSFHYLNGDGNKNTSPRDFSPSSMTFYALPQSAVRDIDGNAAVLKEMTFYIVLEWLGAFQISD